MSARTAHSISALLLSLFFAGTSAQTNWNKSGMTDVQAIDSTIVVKMAYATADNFTGKVLYRDLNKAYLRPEVAQKVIKAQQLLQALKPGYRLIILDAARPLSIQRTMWEVVKNTPQQKYVSNPLTGGGLHNYGAAVDLSILDNTGKELPMGTPFDHFGEEAHITHEKGLVAQGKLTTDELENRLLLRYIMTKAGFTPLAHEWWHFNAYSRDYAVKYLPLLP